MYNIKYFARKKIILLLLITIISLIVFLVYKYSYILCNSVDCVSFASNNTWKEKEIYQNDSSTYRALLEADGYSIRIEKNLNLSEKDANILTTVNIMKIKGLFEDAVNPYTGEISNKISCDNKYKPDIKTAITNNTNITYYTGWLNDRLQYGTCMDDQLTYKAYNALLYCQDQKALYHFEFIVATKDNPTEAYFLNEIKSMKCQNPFSKIGNVFP